MQDEADLRVISAVERDGPTLLRRGRASKVQQHVLQLLIGGMQYNVPTELEALADKTAATLATSFEALLRPLVGKLMQPEAVVAGAASGGKGRGQPTAGEGSASCKRRHATARVVA